MTLYRLIVVGPEELVSAVTRTAWREAAVELLGPVTPERLMAGDLQGFDGALIDITTGDDDIHFDLSEWLEQAAIPSLYVVSGVNRQDRTQLFVLNEERSDIDNILSHLFRDGDDGVRH